MSNLGRERVLSILALATFVAMIGNGIVNPLITVYSQGFGASGLWLGIVFSSFAISRSIVSPIIGKFSDRHERKRLMLFGMAAYAAFSLLYVVADSVYSLVAVRILHGAASAFIAPVVMAYGSEISDPDKRGSSLGLLTAARFFGFGIGPLIGGFVGYFFGVKMAFVVMAGFALFALVLMWLLVPPHMPVQSAQMKRTRYRDLVRNKALVSMALFRLFMAAGGAFTIAFIPLIGHELGFSLVEVSVILAFNVLASGFFQYLSGKFADAANKMMLIMLGSAAVGASLVWMAFSHTFMEFLIVGTLLAAAQALTIPASAAVTSAIGKYTGHGAAMGVWNFGLDIGVGLGPLVAGFLYDDVGHAAIFAVMGGITFVGMVVAYAVFLSDSRRKEYL